MVGNAKCNPSDGYQSNPQCKWPTDCCHVFQALPGDVNSEIGICDSCNIGRYECYYELFIYGISYENLAISIIILTECHYHLIK